MHNNNAFIIREIRQEEINILKDMLYESIFQADPNKTIPREVINIPEIKNYIENFGQKKEDYCLVADYNNKIIGAVWVRILADEIKGYGYVNDETPEFAISLYQEYRNQGIGTQMMRKMISYLKNKGYCQTSLSVQKDNYAVKMYKKLGFKIIDENEEDYLMLLKLKSTIL
ncbi:GNAT family N-acetyltransferase [bacterium]|nr:GNAT family N-acetyltransferase [bacterium]